MYKHSKNSGNQAASAESLSKPDMSSMPEVLSAPPITTRAVKDKDASPAALRDLLEKNLKWSQIIYEQNRRLNSKLFWAAVAGWIRLFLILAPLVIGLVFLPPLIRNFFSRYSNFIQDLQPGGGTSPGTIDEVLKLLPVDSAQKEQFKALFK